MKDDTFVSCGSVDYLYTVYLAVAYPMDLLSGWNQLSVCSTCSVQHAETSSIGASQNHAKEWLAGSISWTVALRIP